MNSGLPPSSSELASDEFVKPLLCRISTMALTDLVEIEAQSNAPAWSATLFSEELRNPDSYFFGAQCNQQLTGYLCANVILAEAHILKFGVRQSWRGRGIGRALLLYSLNELSLMRVSVVWLEVRASNTIAQTLYKAVGFSTVGRRRGYYSDNGEDAVLMKYAY